MSQGLADRVALLKNEGAYKVLARANELEAEGKDIIHLEIGQPDLPTSVETQIAIAEALVFVPGLARSWRRGSTLSRAGSPSTQIRPERPNSVRPSRLILLEPEAWNQGRSRLHMLL